MTDYQFRGLTDADVEKRKNLCQVNVCDNNIFKSRKEIIKTHTLTYFNFLNIFLGVLILMTGQIKNMTFMGVIIINTIIGIVQELKVKNLVDKLSVMTASKAHVIRDGEQQEIPVDEVVMDDILMVAGGDQICADCVVLSSEGIEVNESMLSGESKPVKKKEGDKLLSGSFLVAGSGIGKVEHVGEENYAAQLTRKAKTKKRATSEMQNTIKRIIKIIGILIIPIGILLFRSQMGAEGADRNEAIVSTVAGIIGMIPEGLVLLTSVSFILGVGRLAKKRALVQEMEAIEALARVNVLCLDKTGTITTGELEVADVIAVQDNTAERITQIMNELTFAFEDVNNTQTALMNHFHHSAIWTVDKLIPFSSDRKYRAVSFVNMGCYVLGAPEFLLKAEDQLLETVNRYSEEGMRVLLLGECDAINPEDGSVAGVKSVGLILISDCIRPEAKDTFAYFKDQKVEIKVISGDNPVTVSNIAVKAGLEKGDKYIDASTLPEDPEELRLVADNYTVYGRVRPEQKQKLIKAFRANGNVVGMVGDGVNDVLALKDADCGIAMAAGSDAAKQVAHIVLLDSNFACLRNIVSEGRTIISNIERVSALYLTKTIYAMILNVICILFAIAYPFIPIQLSWISTSFIGIPSFILALEHCESVSSKGFLRSVMRTALPCALTMVLALLTVEIISPFWGDDSMLTYTLNMVVGGSLSAMVVIKVCKPMSWLRRILCVAVDIIFSAGLLLLPGFFGIRNIFCWQMVLAIPMICMVILLSDSLTKLVLLIYKLRDMAIVKLKERLLKA